MFLREAIVRLLKAHPCDSAGKLLPRNDRMAVVVERNCVAHRHGNVWRHGGWYGRQRDVSLFKHRP